MAARMPTPQHSCPIALTLARDDGCATPRKGSAMNRYRRNPDDPEVSLFSPSSVLNRLAAGAGAGEATSQGAAPQTAPNGARAEPIWRTPLDVLRDFQNGPRIPRPNLAESFIPVVGPAWEAAGDLQDGNYAGAAFNAAAAGLDALPIGPAVKGINAARKGITILKDGSVSANAAAKMMRARGFAKTGQEIHHSQALQGASRTAQDWRNHFAFLKVLPKDVHRRVHGSWGGKPQFDPVRRLWYGTTDWQKAIPAAMAGYAADSWENLTHPFATEPRR
jgi:hypothetical protein